MWSSRCNVVLLFLLGARSIVASRVQFHLEDSQEVQSFLTLGDQVEAACISALEMLASPQNLSNSTQAKPAQLATVKSHDGNLRATNKTSAELKKEEASANQTINHTTNLVVNQTSNQNLNHTQKMKQELDNLQHLFGHLKGRIGILNRAEREGHEEDDKMIKEQEEIIQRSQAQLNWTNLTKTQRELRVNRTRSAEVELAYWKKHRSLSHGSFHANLKMSHGLMDKLQQTMKIFNKVIAGKKVAKKDIEAIKRGLPSAKASFLQLVLSYFDH